MKILTHPFGFPPLLRKLWIFVPGLFFLLASQANAQQPGAAEGRVRMTTLAAQVTERGAERPDLSRVLTDQVAHGLGRSPRVRMIEWRSRPDVIRVIEDVQRTSPPEQYASQVGRMLGVDQVVIVTCVRLDAGWTITLKVVDVGSGELLLTEVQSRVAELERGMEDVMGKVTRNPAFGVAARGVVTLPAEVERALIRARTLADNQQVDRAVEVLDRLTAQQPVAAETLRRSALMYVELGRSARAVEVLEAWLDKADPNDPRYAEMMTLSVQTQGNLEQDAQHRAQAAAALASARAGLAVVRAEQNPGRASDQALTALESMSRFATQPANAGLSEEQRREWGEIRAVFESTLRQPRVVDLGGNVRMELLLVAAGSFRMGSASGGFDDERPVREVRITRGYWMGKTEVTQGQWQALMGNNPSRFAGDNRPVEGVSWNEAVQFCSRLTERERAAGRLPEGYVFRLPTEAEWEYAARGGGRGRNTTYAGSDNLGDVGWFDSMTWPVGRKGANELGLYDLSGNVAEWVHDWYQDSYNGLGEVDPVGPYTGSLRVSRGGSWNGGAAFCRVASRLGFAPSDRDNRFGFRVVLAPQLR